MEKFQRYSRQMRVPGFEFSAQERLNNTVVMIVGAGGLGGPVAAQLCGAGIGKIVLIDFDVIALNNLHRQWLFVENDIGKPKVNVLKRHLTKLNSNVKIEAHLARVNPANIAELLTGVDLVIDAADNFPTSYLLSDACALRELALLTASVNQRFGYLGIFCTSGAPSLRAVFPRMPATPTSCDIIGVSGPAVTVVASLQAQAALDWLAQFDNNLCARILYVDLKTNRLHTVDCSTATEPSGEKVALICTEGIQPEDWVIDVREAAEVAAAPQPFSVQENRPLAKLELSEFSPCSQRMVFACTTGQRALMAAQHAQANGQRRLAVILPGDA